MNAKDISKSGCAVHYGDLYVVVCGPLVLVVFVISFAGTCMVLHGVFYDISLILDSG